MLFISCRENFWKDSKLSPELQWGEVGRDGATRLLTPEEIEARLDQMKNRRILLMIHGFNDMEKPVVHHFFGVADFTQKYVVDTSGQCYFEEVIGFAWPGYSHFFDYFLAEENALASAPLLQELLLILSVNVKQLDVFAHSMGNRVFLEALDFPRGPGDPIIHTYFAAGPAVDEKSVYNDKAFFQSISHIREIVVLYSLKDPIEKWFYPIAERATALGAEGDLVPKDLPENVLMVDCTLIVHHHHAYFDQEHIYHWMRKRKAGEIQGPDAVQDIKISPDGEIVVIRWRKTPDQKKVS